MLERISSYSGSVLRGYQTNSMQSQLSQLVAELSSGQKTNPEASLGTSAALLYQLQSQSDQQTGLQTAITTGAQRLDTAQTALSSLGSVVQRMTLATQGVPGIDVDVAAVGSQATSTIGQVLGLLNTSFGGRGVFAGNSGASQPMQGADAPGGLSSITQGTLDAAVSAKGGPLSQSDITSLINGPDGLSSVFDDTNSDPSHRYGRAIYSGSTDGKPTEVIIGASQSVRYDASANQPAFRDLLKGLSMLSMLNAQSSQLDTSAKSELLSQAGKILATAQSELTAVQGSIGAVQSSLSSASDSQKSAAAATQAQILTYVQADNYSNASQISMLQTQLQATYTLTSQISQLSLVRYMPSS
jgi:flagellar hook-associated protein 3 FlgL